MYEFVKLKDENNEYDHREVVHRVVTEGLTWYELIDEFVDFLRGCGYTIPNNVFVDVPEDERG